MNTFKQFITEHIQFDKNKWLSNHKHRINEDGTVDIDGNVLLSYNSLYVLPFQFGTINGNFECVYNLLTSLKNAPKCVNGGFFCFNNQLKTLEGAPKKIKTDFDCSFNQLTSLEGGPELVGENFYINYNKHLMSLDHLPEHIGGKVFCSNNFSSKDLTQAIEKAKNKKYIRTLEYEDEVEGIGDIFD